MSQRPNLLIVDNNAEELMQLITFMENNYELTDVSEGEACIDQASTLNPDLILIDDMIVEPNCYDVCQAIKANANSSEIPIVLMSDLDADELDSEINFLGADDYICRPIEKESLLEKIETLLSFRRLAN